MNSLTDLQTNEYYKNIQTPWSFCIVYARQSTQNQQSLDEQTTACLNHAANLGYHYANVITYKGSAWNGQNFKNLGRQLKSYANTDALFVYDVSRFTRDVISALKLLESIDRHNICVYSIVDGIKWDNTRESQEQFMEKMLEAQKFSTALSNRIKRKNEFLKSKGSVFGNAPYGKQVERSEDGIRKFVDNDEELNVLYTIAKWIEGGATFEDAGCQLNDMGIKKRGKEWTTDMARYVYKNNTEFDYSVQCITCKKWHKCTKNFAKEHMSVWSFFNCEYVGAVCDVDISGIDISGLTA